MFSAYKRIWISVGIFTTIIGLGTAGYMVVEGWTTKDSFYMTMITLSTVGFQEVQPLSENGKTFTMFLIVLGIGTVGYGFGNVAALLVEEELRKSFQVRKMDKAIGKLSDHIIICGYGVEGRHTCEEFRRSKVPFLIIEKDAELTEKIKQKDYLVIQGDATQDEVMLSAGVATAKGLIAAVHDDSENVFLVLTARGFNPNLIIVARASDEKSVSKLFRAGANKVISSAEIGGRRMASAILRPKVMNFLDVIIHDQELSLNLEEINVGEKSAFVGKSIRDLNIRGRTGTMVIGYHRAGKPMQVNPDADTILDAGDVLIVLGSEARLKIYRKLQIPINWSFYNCYYFGLQKSQWSFQRIFRFFEVINANPYEIRVIFADRRCKKFPLYNTPVK